MTASDKPNATEAIKYALSLLRHALHADSRISPIAARCVTVAVSMCERALRAQNNPN